VEKKGATAASLFKSAYKSVANSRTPRVPVHHYSGSSLSAKTTKRLHFVFSWCATLLQRTHMRFFSRPLINIHCNPRLPLQESNSANYCLPVFYSCDGPALVNIYYLSVLSVACAKFFAPLPSYAQKKRTRNTDRPVERSEGDRDRWIRDVTGSAPMCVRERERQRDRETEREREREREREHAHVHIFMKQIE
jgi:hypothetical protein